MAINVLVVLDGVFGFTAPTSASDPDFTYSTLIGALTGAGMQVTRAHRGVDPTASPMMQNFHFNAAANLLQYDVIWLIAHQGRNFIGPVPGSPSSNVGLGDDEIREIARFMAAGGGVFATGDHDSVGVEMCGHIPRVRAMRSWYGAFDTASPMPGSFPRNFPVTTAGRADTTQRNPGGDYNGDATFVWFENQSDHIPQPIAPATSPTHPILRRNGADIIVYPDHMHEGQTLGTLAAGYDYTQSLTFSGETFPEFPLVAGHREGPQVIATGQTTGLASRHTADGAFVGMDGAASTIKTTNALSVYDGRVAGVGRIVTGSTFHHYIDINLTGDSSVNDAQNVKTGPDARKGHGFSDPVAAETFASIQAVYVNITRWLARPRPAISLILERSTFSQAEAMAAATHPGALLVTVDGLKPGQFPGGPINSLSPGAAALANWAPAIALEDASGITVTPTGVSSDDPMLADRVQRFTFTYEVDVTNAAFLAFPGPTRTLRVDASLASAAVATPLTDRAWIELVKAANPYMLDLANNNTTAWLSSDLRVFPVVADGGSHHGQTLADNASRAQALHYLKDVVDNMTPGDFEALSLTEPGSALSPLSTTTASGKNVYNFAIARVRLNHAAAASNVRVAFRLVPSPTTASLTYHESMGVPTGSYKQTNAADPIALPGTNAMGTQWLSFPCFAQARTLPPDTQADDNNLKPMGPAGNEISVFYGALIDNNLSESYLPAMPGGGTATTLPMLMMGEHQCLVAQVMAAGVPIPDGAQPATSDKLAQRNLAFSTIANPGLDASRMAVHTFEIEAAMHPIGEKLPPDELLLDWRGPPPDGTEIRIYIPTWDAQAVVELADRFYPRHEIRAVDAHTVAVPGGGMRYVPVPPTPLRQTGVISADFPIGVKSGERFDLAVRQISNRGRTVDAGQPKAQTISRAEAARLIAGLKRRPASPNRVGKDGVERGVFDLGKNRVLVTDLQVLDQGGDHAVIIEHVDPKKAAEARRQSGVWRETIGAFQLGIPVSVKGEMLHYHARLLSALRWRAEHLRPDSRWYASFRHYVELIAKKVAALGGDPYCVPPRPDGDIPPPRDRCGKSGDQKD